MLTRLLLAFALALAFCPFSATTAAAHPGGTNAEGCHTDHRTGEYHCHTPKTPMPGRETYCHVINGEHRCGYALSTCTSLARQYGGFCVRE